MKRCVEKPGIRPVLLGLLGLLVGGWLLPTTAWALQHPYFSKHPKAAKQLEALLQQTGLQALELQPADLSLTLQDLKGNDHALRRYRGKVLLLTRWATWCGACKSEIPFKNRLAEQIKSERFAILGISDESRDTVQNYHQSASVTYANSLVDSKGVVTKFFPGGAVPVTLVVDGWGWLIAMKRGAAPWHKPAYAKLIRYLISIAPSREQLKEKAPAPLVSFPQQVHVKEGDTFSLVFSLRWVGESDKYPRIAFRFPKEKGLQRLGVRTSGVLGDKASNQRQYTLRMKALKTGTYHLAPVLMNYWIKDYDQHFQVNAGAITVEVTPATATAHSRQQWPLIILGVALLLLFVLGIALRRQMGARSLPSEEELARQKLKQTLEVLLSELFEAHQSDDPKAQIEAIYQIHHKILHDVPPEVSSARDDIRYGGHHFPTDQRRQLLARLAADLKAYFPDAAHRIQAL